MSWCPNVLMPWCPDVLMSWSPDVLMAFLAGNELFFLFPGRKFRYQEMCHTNHFIAKLYFIVYLQATLVLEVLLDSKVIPLWTLCKTPLNIQGPDVTYSSWIEGQPMVRCECSFCILFPVWSKSKVFNICAGTYIFEKASFTSKSYLCVNCSGTLLVSLILIQYPITANCKKNILERKVVQFFCCSFGKVTFMHPCDVFLGSFAAIE